VLSADDAQAVIREQTPLPARTVTELGRGADSVAFLVDDEWVARFPMVADARDTLRRELALLPMLAPALPVAIPAVEHVARRGDELLFAAYRSLPGEPLTAERFASLDATAQDAVLAGIAELLRALHAFPVADAVRAGVQEELLNGAYHEAQRALPHAVESVLGRADAARLADAFRRYDRDRRPADSPVAVLHADLKPAHVLVDGGALSGVIDWGDVCLGDPDFDLALIAMFFGQDIVERLLEHLHGRDADQVLDKTRFFTTLRWTQDLAFAMRRADRAATTSAVQRLREHLQ
jgi:aminoglycoside phosphotransferase (APT) family kinase protein